MWKLPKDTQKGIFALEDMSTDKVKDAKYGTFKEFKDFGLAHLGGSDAGKYKTNKDLEKLLDVQAMDDWEGINFWVILPPADPKKYLGMTFFWFQKDGGPAVCPTAKLSQYFEKYEPFLKKNAVKKPATKSSAKKPVAKKTVKR